MAIAVEQSATGRPRFWVLTQAGGGCIEVWGVGTEQRLVRTLRAAGVPAADIGIGPAEAVPATPDSWIILRADHVFEDRLVHGLLSSAGVILVGPGGVPVAAHVAGGDQVETLRFLTRVRAAAPAGLRVVSPAALVTAYSPSLRRSAEPLLLRVTPHEVASIEHRLFAASYKDITDLVTKWLWPAPARGVTRYLARRHVHPNVVTLLSWALVVLATVLFARGWYIDGLAAAWLMTFLDTVDGKLARVTLTASRAGGALDHGLDLLHPPFWYAAWAIGGAASGPWWSTTLAIVIGGYIAGRVIEGLFLLFFGLEIHCWRRLDSRFRLVTARRNPNLILLTLAALAGEPVLGLELVAVWTALSLGFHGVRLAQAIVRRTRGQRITPWLGQAASSRTTTESAFALERPA